MSVESIVVNNFLISNIYYQYIEQMVTMFTHSRLLSYQLFEHFQCQPAAPIVRTPLINFSVQMSYLLVNTYCQSIDHLIGVNWTIFLSRDWGTFTIIIYWTGSLFSFHTFRLEQGFDKRMAGRTRSGEVNLHQVGVKLPSLLNLLKHKQITLALRLERSVNTHVGVIMDGNCGSVSE